MTPSEQFEPEICVHCLLFTGRKTPEAHINRTYAIDEPSSFTFPDAEASLWQAQDSCILSYVSDDWYSGPDSLDIAPFDTFYMRVAKDGFDTVYGHTVVPDTFSILSPHPGDTVAMDDSLVWTRSQGCKGYYTSVRRETPRDTFSIAILIPNESIPGIPWDSLEAWLPLFFLGQQPEGEYTLRLAALDTNYFDWVGFGGFGPGSGMQSGGSSSTVTGGIGVFGSAVMCSVKVYVKHDTVMGRSSQLPGSSQSRRKSKPVSRVLANPPTRSLPGFPGLSSHLRATGLVSPEPPPE